MYGGTLFMSMSTNSEDHVLVDGHESRNKCQKAE